MTSLSRQLSKLATPQSSALGVEKKRASLLFEKKDASGFDKETIHKIGLEGLEKLIELDEGFEKSREPLFGTKAMGVERSVMNKENNRVLDEQIDAFICRAIPYLVLKPAHQALEWLIYRFHIHSYNCSLLLRVSLLYHDTSIFARLLQIIPLDPNDRTWAWMASVRKAQSTLTRHTLLNHCCNDPSFLKYVCDTIQVALPHFTEEELSSKFQILFSFVTSLVIGTLAEQSTQVNNALVSQIIPHIVTDGLRSSIKPYNLAVQMITCQLCISTVLAKNTVEALLKLILLKLKPENVEQSLKTALVICQRQAPRELPRKAVKKLSRKSKQLELISAIISLSSNFAIEKFFEPLIRSLCRFLPTEGDDFKEFVADLCEKIKLSDESAYAVLRIFLEQYTELEGDRKEFATILADTVATLCRRYPVAFDKVREEWTVRDADLFGKWTKHSNLPVEEIGVLVKDMKIDKIEAEEPEPKRIKEEESDKIVLDEQIDPFAPKLEMAPLEGEIIALLKDAIENQNAQEILRILPHISSDYFSSLSPKKQTTLALLLMKINFETQFEQGRNEVILAVKNVMKQFPLPAALVCRLISGEKLDAIGSPKKRSSNSENIEIEPNKVIFALEAMHANMDHSGGRNLVICLFDLLEKIIADENRNEFMLQLTLSALTSLCSNEQTKPKLLRNDFKVDLLIKCLRMTHSFRTLHESLRLLNVATEQFQDAVLSHIMSLFTFMGTGLFRKDDNFSLDMVHKTMDTVIGALVTSTEGLINLETKLLELYRLFVSSLSDIAGHRRLTLLTRLALAGADKTKNVHLWMLVGLLIEHMVIEWKKEKTEGSSEEELCISICSNVSAQEQLQCALNLVRYLIHLDGHVPDQEGKHGGHRLSYPMIFDKKLHTSKQLRHFRYVLMGWIGNLFADKQLIEQLASQTEDLTSYIGGVSEQLFNTLLICLQNFTKQSQICPEADKPYWAAMAGRTDLALKKLKELLPASVSLGVISSLLERESPQVKKNALELLGAKLLQQPTPFTREHVPQLSNLSGQLCDWLSLESTDPDIVALSQTAAYCLKLLVRVIGTYEPEAFVPVLDRVVLLLHAWRQINPLLLGNALLCLAELVACLRTSTLAKLPLFLKDVIDVLRDEELLKSQDLLLISGVSCVHKLLEHLSSFVSPHLPELTEVLVTHWSRAQAPIGQDTVPAPMHSHLLHRLKHARKRLACLPSRTVIPAFVETFGKRRDQPDHLSSLFSLLTEHIVNADDLKTQLPEITELLLDALGTRARLGKDLELDSIAAIEDNLLESVAKMSLKLSENNFRPFLFRVAEWSKDSSQPLRLITVFRMMLRLAVELGNLVVLFAPNFAQMCPDILQKCNWSKTEKPSRLLKSKENSDLLLCSVLDFIAKCCLLDPKRFMIPERFPEFLEPLTEQLENTKLGGYENRVHNHLIPAISAFGTASDETGQRKLSYDILLKMRSHKHTIRNSALLTVGDLYEKLADSAVSLIPEAMPFLAELLEDDKDEVEANCQKLIKKLEKIVGKSADEYF